MGGEQQARGSSGYHDQTGTYYAASMCAHGSEGGAEGGQGAEGIQCPCPGRTTWQDERLTAATSVPWPSAEGPIPHSPQPNHQRPPVTACTCPHAQNTWHRPCSTKVPASSLVRTSASCRQLLPPPPPPPPPPFPAPAPRPGGTDAAGARVAPGAPGVVEVEVEGPGRGSAEEAEEDSRLLTELAGALSSRVTCRGEAEGEVAREVQVTSARRERGGGMGKGEGMLTGRTGHL